MTTHIEIRYDGDPKAKTNITFTETEHLIYNPITGELLLGCQDFSNSTSIKERDGEKLFIVEESEKVDGRFNLIGKQSYLKLIPTNRVNTNIESITFLRKNK